MPLTWPFVSASSFFLPDFTEPFAFEWSVLCKKQTAKCFREFWMRKKIELLRWDKEFHIHTTFNRINQFSDWYVFNLSFTCLLAVVGLFVKFFEQEEEHDSMHANPPYEGFWIVAIDEEKLKSVKHDKYKLNLKLQDEHL